MNATIGRTRAGSRPDEQISATNLWRGVAATWGPGRAPGSGRPAGTSASAKLVEMPERCGAFQMTKRGAQFIDEGQA